MKEPLKTAPRVTGTIDEIPPILPVDRLHAMGIVVGDLRTSINEFGQFFGIDEWQIRRLKSGDNLRIDLGGREIDGEILLATGGKNNVTFELYQPVRGETIFNPFLQRRGSSAHDLTTHVLTPAEFDDVLPKLEREGIHVRQTLSLGDALDIHYLDTEAQLATTIKLVVAKTPGAEALDALPPAETVRLALDPTNARFPCDKAYHVCVVTNHRRLSVKDWYQRLFGLDRWFELDSEVNVTATECYHHGKPGDWRFKTAAGRRGAFSIEIVETVYGKCGYTDMLETRGEGIHHLMTAFCELDAVEAAENALAADGYAKAQSGVTGPIYYCYLVSPGKLANLGIEAVCPIGDDWKEWMADNISYILFGPNRPDYRDPPAAAGRPINE